MNSTKDNGIMSEVRLDTLENEIKHINSDVDEIKGELSDIRTINTSVSKSLERLSVIVEQNQKLEPKIDHLSDRISKNEKFIWQAGAVIAFIAAVAPFVAPLILNGL